MLDWCQHKQVFVLYASYLNLNLASSFFANVLHKFLWGWKRCLSCIGHNWLSWAGSGNGLGFWGFSCLFLGFVVFSRVLWFWRFLGGTFCHVVAASRKVVASHGNVVLTIRRKTSTLGENSIWLEPFGSTSVVDKWSFREIYTRQCKLNWCNLDGQLLSEIQIQAQFSNREKAKIIWSQNQMRVIAIFLDYPSWIAPNVFFCMFFTEYLITG
jgi:hypothetical protein